MTDTRLKLLKISAELFAKNGFSGTSIRQISQAAGTNVSAVHYHFGDKRALFYATVEHLVADNNLKIFGDGKTMPSAQEIAGLSRAEALERLHRLLDRFLDIRLSHQDMPLERIFAHAKLEKSRHMLKMLLQYLAPCGKLLAGLLMRLTGLPEKSTELLILTHTVFGQINVSECTRQVILHELDSIKYNAHTREEIKKTVWNNMCAILKSYEKRMKKQ